VKEILPEAGNLNIKQPRNLEVSASDAELLANISKRGCLHEVLIEPDGVEANPGIVQQVGAEEMVPVHDRIFDRLVRALSGTGCAEKASAEGRIAQVLLRPAPEQMILVEMM